MKKLFLLMLCSFLLLLSSQALFAAENTKVLLALEQAKNAVNQLNLRSAGNNLVEEDLTAARRYLQQAEKIYKDNTGWMSLRGLSEAVELEIVNNAEKSEHTAKIGLLKIDRQAVEQEYVQLEKKVATAKDKVRILEEKAAEMAALKATTSKLESAAKEVVTLKADQAAVEQIKKENVLLLQKSEGLLNEKKSLLEQLEALKLEKATLTGQLEAIRAERKVDELQAKKQQERITALEKELIPLQQNKQDALKSGTKLSAAERSADFKAKLSNLGALADITENSIVLILPRRDLIKTSAKGHLLSSEAEKNVQKLVSLMGQFPEYRLSLQVFGYAKPANLEGQKAAEQMARIVRDFFALHLGVKADTIQASGETTASPLFSTATAEPHRRIELKFTKGP